MYSDRLLFEYELTRTYQAKGQIKRAMRLLEHVVSVLEQTSCQHKLSRLASPHELAQAYQADG